MLSLDFSGEPLPLQSPTFSVSTTTGPSVNQGKLCSLSGSDDDDDASIFVHVRWLLLILLSMQGAGFDSRPGFC